MSPYLLMIIIVLLALGTVLLVGFRYRFLLGMLLLAFSLRFGLVFLDYFDFFSVPGGGSDALGFVLKARAWSMQDWPALFGEYSDAGSYVYSFLGAIVFKLFGYHLLILPLINLLAGTLVVSLTGIIAYRMWGSRPAQLSTLIIGLYPFAAFNSAIALREEPSILAFMIGLYFLVKWLQEESRIGVYLCLVFFAMATIIHAGWVAAIFGVGTYALLLLFKALPRIFRGSVVTRGYFRRIMMSTSIVVLSLMLSAAGEVSLGKGISLGSEEKTVAELIESQFVDEPTGGSAYPTAIAMGNPFSQPWLIPTRVVYFVFSPFPWDISSPRHLLGMVSTVLYFFLAWRIYKGWGNIKRKQECVALLIILAMLIFVFAIGVTNIGTAIRHKTKFLALFILLAAASFDSIKFKLRR